MLFYQISENGSSSCILAFPLGKRWTLHFKKKNKQTNQNPKSPPIQIIYMYNAFLICFLLLPIFLYLCGICEISC